MFLALVKNEFIKLFAKKKTYIVILLFIALLGILVAVGEGSENSYLRNNDPKMRIENLENQIRYETEYIENMKKDENISKEDLEAQINSSEQYIKDLDNQIQSLKIQVENASKDYWKEDAKRQITDLNESLANTTNQDDKAYLSREIKKIKTHLNHNIPLDEGNMNYGFNHFYLSLGFITLMFLGFGLVLFNSDNISGEYNPGTLKFLLIQPVTRIKVLLSKFVVMVLSSLGLIIGIQTLFLVGVGLIKGFGSLYRPMLVGIKYEYIMENGQEILSRIANSGYYISFGEYLLRMLFLEILSIITITAFIYMVSTISKSSVISMTIGIGIFLGSTIIYNLSHTYRKFSFFNFLHYTDVDSIVSGTIVGNTGALNFTYPIVVISSLITTILFITISCVFFKKRDILI
ncbi:MAG: putative transporter, permease protein [Anaerocolumna sp.]|jgi:ABC-2 type transport system permease protein|nr:putative transporter, permease protein [Anaerocolumna sp.]